MAHTPHAAKLADRIRTVVAEALERRVKDPRLGFVTITDVRVTGDMREATLFYTVLGDDKARESSTAALASATGMLRTTVSRELGLKYTPTLTFVLDALPESAAALEDVLRAAKAQNDEVSQMASHASYAGESDPYRKPTEDNEDSSTADER